MKSLPITLVACVTSNDLKYYLRTIMVLHYCAKMFRFDRVIMFSHIPPPIKVHGEVIQTPKLDLEQYGIWWNKNMPAFIASKYLMQVHEDGFILDPSRWQDKFLDYDYIGAPWRDGIVGNGAFCIESQKLLQEKVKLPFAERLSKLYDGQNYDPADVFLCRTHRTLLESRGIRFAPRDVALEFATEQIGQRWPSFGYHSKKVNQYRYWGSFQHLIHSL